jgi:hypothetical protein
VVSSRFYHEQYPNEVAVKFSEDVSRSLVAADLIVTHLASGVSARAASVQYAASTHTATFRLSGRLPDGNYRATFVNGGVADAAGNALPSGFGLEFYSLSGDVNRDRVVNSADLAVITANLGKSGRTYAQGDLNDDGRVNSVDRALVTGNMGKSVSALTTLRLRTLTTSQPVLVTPPALPEPRTRFASVQDPDDDPSLSP